MSVRKSLNRINSMMGDIFKEEERNFKPDAPAKEIKGKYIKKADRL